MYPHEFNKLKIEELGGYGRYGNIILFTQFFSIKKSIKKKTLTATIKEGKIKTKRSPRMTFSVDGEQETV